MKRYREPIIAYQLHKIHTGRLEKGIKSVRQCPRRAQIHIHKEAFIPVGIRTQSYTHHSQGGVHARDRHRDRDGKEKNEDDIYIKISLRRARRAENTCQIRVIINPISQQRNCHSLLHITTIACKKLWHLAYLSMTRFLTATAIGKVVL